MLNFLQKLAHQQALTLPELALLLEQELTKHHNPFQLNPKTGLEQIKIRGNLFTKLYPNILKICHNFGLTNREIVMDLLWRLWLPLSIQIAEKKAKNNSVFIQGILGGQGTGKTTLTSILTLILQELGYSSVSISIDDLYKTYAQRQELKKQDPRLIYRGAPQTHDLNLGLELFKQLHDQETTEILIPRFDKSAYDGNGERTNFERVNKPDLVLFEGWLVGVRPINESLFNHPPHPILTPEDIQFAKDNNQRLADYLPLWEQLDSLIILDPQDYHFSLQWRKDAEHQMIAQGKTGMSDQEIENFVYYFWRSLHPELFIKPLTKNVKLVDLVIEINQDHLPAKIARPK
jgi:D-glycerate 3-kinase